MGNALSASDVVVGYTSANDREVMVLSKHPVAVSGSRQSLVALHPTLGAQLAVLNTKHLDLNHNLLTEINMTCVTAASATLTILNLSFNNLNSLPSDFHLLSQLCMIDLSHNNLTALPACFGDLSHLRSLRLNNNQLTELPIELAKLDDLNSLNVSFNLLRFIPASLNALKNLHLLITNDNPFLTREDVALLLPATLQQIKPSSTRSSSFILTPHDSTNTNTITTNDAISRLVDPPRVCSLKELCARTIVRYRLPVDNNNVPQEVLAALSSCHTCTACAGPYFGEPFLRYRFVRRGVNKFPLQHRLCSDHWTTEEQRIKYLFQPSPSLSPPEKSSLSLSTLSFLSKATPKSRNIFKRLEKK